MSSNNKENIVTVSASIRNKTGKGAARKLRTGGYTPAVLYGHNISPQHLSIPTKEFAAILRQNGSNAVVNIELNGTKKLALTKQVSINFLKNSIEHIDFIVIKQNERVNVEVNINSVGNIAPGGMLIQDTNIIEIEANVLNIPEIIEVSVANLEIGAHILAKDITLPTGIKLISDPDLIIFNVVEPTQEETEPNTEATDTAESSNNTN